MNILKVNQLTKHFGTLAAVVDLSFTVNKGSIFGILGPNGSGKSTTLGMLLHVIHPTSGSWQWFGKAPSHRSLKKIGALIEQPNFYPYLTGYQNLKIAANIKEVSSKKIDSKLELMGLVKRKNDKFKAYSLGMKQRLAIASALLSDPEVLILDEPTNGLDPKGIADTRKIIKTAAAMGTTIILASHLLDEVEKVCSDVLVLRDGKAVFCGSVDTLSGSNITLTIAAQDNDALQRWLEGLDLVVSITRTNDTLKVNLQKILDTATLNKQAHANGIILSHLEIHKTNLEKAFLDITNQDQ